MNILIAAHHYAVASGRYMRDAFLRAGHTVYTDGVEHGNAVWGITVDPGYVWHTNPPPRGTEIDLLVVMDSDPWMLFTYQSYPAKQRVVYGVDNHVREYTGDYSHFFLAHAHGPRQPVPSNDPHYSWLPCGYDPTVFRDPLPWEQREYDIAMLGFPYPERLRLQQLVSRMGYKTKFGLGYLYHDCAAIYRNAKISLCSSAAGDIAQRIFETAACGCFVLSDPLHDLLDEYTNKQLKLSGFALYYSDEELEIQLRALLGDESITAEFGAKMMTKQVQRHHTWDHRAEVILEWASNHI